MSKATGIIEGFVAVDPRVNVTQSGKRVANITVAHTPRKREGNEWVDAGPTTWFEASLWDDQVEFAEQLRKGDKVRITGELEGNTYDKRDGGQGFKVLVKFASVGLLERGKPQGGAGGQQSGNASQGQGQGGWGPGEATQAHQQQANGGWGGNSGGFDDDPPF